MDAEPPVARWVDNLVHAPTQIHGTGVDLTLSAVYTVAEPGRIDFGGDELADATLEPLEPTIRSPDDEYGWWHLEGGQYVVQLNEFLSDPDAAIRIQPRADLLARGGSHPVLVVRSHLPLVPLTVTDGGLELKENARISTASAV